MLACATTNAPGVEVDASRVILVDHSGAGCSSEGGLQWVAKGNQALNPMALVAIDTCLDRSVARGFREAVPGSALGIWFQTTFWQRDFASFQQERSSSDAPADRLVVEEIACTHLDAHDRIVPQALLRALQWLIPVQEEPSTSAQRASG